MGNLVGRLLDSLRQNLPRIYEGTISASGAPQPKSILDPEPVPVASILPDLAVWQKTRNERDRVELGINGAGAAPINYPVVEDGFAPWGFTGTTGAGPGNAHEIIIGPPPLDEV